MSKSGKYPVTISPTSWWMKQLMRLFNPMMRRELVKGATGKSMENMILLHFTGRRSGKLYEVPVMKQDVGGRLGVFTDGGWRVNFRGGADIEVTDRGVRRPMHARLETDPEVLADLGLELIRTVGLDGVGKLGMVVNVSREPTREELADAGRRHNLGVVFLTPVEQS